MTAPVEPALVSGPEPELAKPTLEPQKARDAPRIQYARTYVLLPNNLLLGMVLAAMRAAYDAKSTVGFAASDSNSRFIVKSQALEVFESGFAG